MKLVDRKELVEATGGKLTFWTIGQLTREKKIPHILIGKRHYLYDLEAVEQWLDSLQKESIRSD